MAQLVKYLNRFLIPVWLLAVGLDLSATEVLLDVEFRVFGIPPPEGLIFRNADGSVVELLFLNSGRSPIYRYRGTNPIAFFREEVGALSKASVGSKLRTVASVRFLPEEQRPLLLFFPDRPHSGGDEQYRVVSFDDSPSVLPCGSVMFFNASGAPMVGQVGETRVELRFGPSRSFVVKGSVSSSFFVFFDNRYHYTFESPISCSSEERLLLFFSPPMVEGSSEVQYRMLRESRRPELEGKEDRLTTGN